MIGHDVREHTEVTMLQDVLISYIKVYTPKEKASIRNAFERFRRNLQCP